MKEAAVVGATGIVGQQFLAALKDHPWFKVTTLAASEKSAGKRFEEALKDPNTGALRWFVNESPPANVLGLMVEDASKLDASEFDVVFTAIESDQAKVLEPKFANTTPVVSTASAFRYEKDVPIIIPGINSNHVSILDFQRKERNWEGYIVPIPNCTTTGLVICLKPIYENFGITDLIMTSMQAVSGAGRSPGVIALEIVDNIIPFIPNEEEKVKIETKKILGNLKDNTIDAAKINISTTCTRANVLEGHTESVFISTKQKCSINEIIESLKKFSNILKDSHLPSTPEEMIIVQEDPFRPQPRLDRDTNDGMTTTVGRIRIDEVFQNGIKFILVSHNTKMGAAKGAVLLAELLVDKGYI
jgi:aspartate-semialdehyde dehydrogenase